jgi:hypothetical protein
MLNRRGFMVGTLIFMVGVVLGVIVMLEFKGR